MAAPGRLSAVQNPLVSSEGIKMDLHVEMLRVNCLALDWARQGKFHPMNEDAFLRPAQQMAEDVDEAFKMIMLDCPYGMSVALDNLKNYV